MQDMRRALAVLPLLLLTACGAAPEPDHPDAGFIVPLVQQDASTGDTEQDIRLAKGKVCFHWEHTDDSYDEVATIMRSITKLDRAKTDTFMRLATLHYCPKYRHIVAR